MEHIIYPVLAGIFSSLLAAYIFIWLIYNNSRPKLIISKQISKTPRNSFVIKVLNKSKFPVVNVKAELHMIKLTNVPQGKLKNFHKVKMKVEEILVLTEYQETEEHERCSWRFSTTEDLDNIFSNGNHLLFWIVGQSSFSNSTKVAEQAYFSKSDIIPGDFVYGNSLEIRD